MVMALKKFFFHHLPTTKPWSPRKALCKFLSRRNS
jgi:hypothetical protein